MMMFFRALFSLLALIGSVSAQSDCETMLHGVTAHPANLADPISAESRAVSFVCSDTGVSDPRLRQRYALALLAYSVTNNDAFHAMVFPNGNECDSALTLCDASNMVTSLVMTGLDLEGTLPPELALMDDLQELFLDQNRFLGRLPPAWGGMEALQKMVLTSNRIGGVVPDTFVALTNLKVFDIEDNDIRGYLPDTFCNINLDEFRADCNQVICCVNFINNNFVCQQRERRNQRSSTCSRTPPAALPDAGVEGACCGVVKTERNIGHVPGFDQRQGIAVTTQQYTDNGNTCIVGLLTDVDYSGPLNICIVLDNSGSTFTTQFEGSPVGDFNGDGEANTILDAEILSTIRFLESLVETPGLSNDNVYLGLVTFSQLAQYLGNFHIADPDHPTKINPVLRDVLLGIRHETVTNFDDALDKAIKCFEEAPGGRTNVLFFLSDGIPNVCGDDDNEAGRFGCTTDGYLDRNNNLAFNGREAAHIYTHELNRLDMYNVRRHAIGVGAQSDISPGSGLDMIDNTVDPEDPAAGPQAVQVTDSDALRNVLTANPVVGNITGFSIRVNGDRYAGIGMDSLESGPVGYSFGPFTLGGLDFTPGAENRIEAITHMEFDGARYSIRADATVTGGPFSGECALLTADQIGGGRVAYGACCGEMTTGTDAAVIPGTDKEQELSITTQAKTDDGTTCAQGLLSVPAYFGPLNICIVIDISGSTYDGGFGGTPVGDVNGDGASDTVLDAEIIATEKFLESIARTAGMTSDNVFVGIITFSTTAEYLGSFPLTSVNDPTKLHPVTRTALRSLRKDRYTNFDDALDKAIDCFEEAPPDRSNVLFFLSDGKPNVCGDGDDESSTYNCAVDSHKNGDAARQYASELARLNELNVTRHAIGVGTGSRVNPGSELDEIDNTPSQPGQEREAVQVTDSDALVDVLTANPVLGNVTSFSVTVNGEPFDGVSEFSLRSGPFGFSFGPFTLLGLDSTDGATNIIEAQCDMEYEGQSYSMTAQTTVAGGEIMGDCLLQGTNKFGGDAKADCGIVELSDEVFDRWASTIQWTCDGSDGKVACGTETCAGYHGGKFMRLWKQKNTATRVYKGLPNRAKFVTVEFDFLRLDGWENSGGGRDYFRIVIGGMEIDLGAYKKEITAANHTEVNGDVTWERTSYGDARNLCMSSSKQDQVMHFVVTAPGDLVQNGELEVQFNFHFTASANDESGGIDNVAVSVTYRPCHDTDMPSEVPSYAPTPEPCARIVANQEFTDSEAGSWQCNGSGGSVACTTQVCNGNGWTGGKYLPLWRERDTATKTFGVPADAFEIQIEFDFLRLDGWETNDGFHMEVGGVRLDFGKYTKNGNVGYGTGTVGDVTWERNNYGPTAHYCSAGNKKDQLFHFVVTAPSDAVVVNDAVTVMFDFHFTGPASDEHGGIDNFQLIATSPMCTPTESPTTMSPTIQTTSPTSSPTEGVPTAYPTTSAPSENPSVAPSDAWCGETVSNQGFTSAGGAALWACEGSGGNVPCELEACSGWRGGDLIRLWRERDIAKRTFTVPSRTGTVRIEFDFVRMDGWEGGNNGDKFELYVGGVKLDLGRYAQTTYAGDARGSASGVTWIRRVLSDVGHICGASNKVDQSFHFEIMAPANTVVSNNEVEIKFDFRFSGPKTDESAGIDNIQVISQYGACGPTDPPSPAPSEYPTIATPGPTASPTMEPTTAAPTMETCERVVDYQSFSNAADTNLWTCAGTDGSGPCAPQTCSGWQGNKHIGLWKQKDTATRTFTGLPSDVVTVQIEFDFLRLGGWENSGGGTDWLHVNVGGTVIDLGRYSRDATAENHSDRVGDIRWSRTKYGNARHICYETDDKRDQDFHIVITAPAVDVISNGELAITFDSHFTANRNDESAGIDNFKLLMHRTDCAPTASPTAGPTAAPTTAVERFCPNQATSGTSETCFAKSTRTSACFIDELTVSAQGNRWGWTNSFSGEAVALNGGLIREEMELWCGAAQCNLDPVGKKVGTVTFSFDGNEATVSIDTTASGATLTEAQVYIGSTELPRQGQGYTTAPGQYGNIHNSVALPCSDEFTGLSAPASGDFYVIVHTSCVNVNHTP